MFDQKSLGIEKIHVTDSNFEYELSYEIIEEIDHNYGNNFIKLEFVNGYLVDHFGNAKELKHEPKSKEITIEKRELKLRYS